MGPSMEEIHPYAANQLVQLFEILTKKFKICSAKLQKQSDQVSISIPPIEPIRSTGFLENEIDFNTHLYEVRKKN